MSTLYDFTVNDIHGKPVALDRYKGKVLLVVNTASECGFTPQYKGLEALYEKYRAKGLEVLGFPCNQFGGQEPGSEAAIEQFCEVNYGVTFPLFAKVDVNGDHAAPVYRYLKSSKPVSAIGNATRSTLPASGCAGAANEKSAPQSAMPRIATVRALTALFRSRARSTRVSLSVRNALRPCLRDRRETW